MKTIVIIVMFFTSTLLANNEIQIVAEEFHPYQFKSADGASGIAVEVIKGALAEVNMTADVQLLPWARAYLTAKENPNTILLSVSRTKNRENQFHWLGQIEKHELHLWVNANKWSTTSLAKDELKSLRIGVPRDGHQHYFITHHPSFKGNSIVIVNTKEQLLKMLDKGRIDALLGDERLLKNRLSRINLSPEIIKSVHKFESQDTVLYIAISKSTDIKLVNALKNSFNKYSQTQEFKKLINWR